MKFEQNKVLSWKYNIYLLFECICLFFNYEKKFINFQTEKMLFFGHQRNNRNKPIKTQYL